MSTQPNKYFFIFLSPVFDWYFIFSLPDRFEACEFTFLIRFLPIKDRQNPHASNPIELLRYRNAHEVSVICRVFNDFGRIRCRDLLPQSRCLSNSLLVHDSRLCQQSFSSMTILPVLSINPHLALSSLIGNSS